MLLSEKMEVLLLLLMFFTVSGYSYIPHPRLSDTQIDGNDTDHHFKMKSELRDVSLSAEDRINEERNIAVDEEWRSEREFPETSHVRKTVKNEKTVAGPEKWDEDELAIIGQEERTEEHLVAGTVSDLDTDIEVAGERKNNRPNHKGVHNKGKYETDVKSKKIQDEQRESELVAGISLQKETRSDKKILTVKQDIKEEKGDHWGIHKIEKEELKNATYDEFAEREKEDYVVVSNLTLSLSTSEISPTDEIITVPQNPLDSSPSPQHNVYPPPPFTTIQVPQVFSFPATTHSKVKLQSFSPSVISPTVSVDPVSLIKDLLIEVFQSPGHHLKQSEIEVKASQNLEDVTVKNLLLKPAQKELQTTRKAQQINTVSQPNKSRFTPEVQDPTPKPKHAKFIARHLKTKEPNPTLTSNKNQLSAKLVKLKPNMAQTGKRKTVQVMENGKSTKPQLTTSKTPSMLPTKNKHKAIKKSKEKKGRKDNKTQKPSEKKKKKVTTDMYFPYFKDNYCPPECACYGRVVQCSDKGVDKVPYGIPYNARYILLMNNRINSIQLDLLSEYVSMEFLVLSNNQLTNGAIEGAFEGVVALKRLYLDRNLLESVPTDLPSSLEELRLDNNRLSIISEAVWAQCPSLLVLSLSNNTLGNGSESLPNAVFSPLCQLRTLNLDHNQLTSVPLGLPLSIKELYLKGNHIKQFSGEVFNGVSELLVLDLSANRLTDKGLVRDSLINATHLESLNFEGNRLKQVPRHLPLSLKTLNLEGNLLTSIKKTDLRALKNLEHLGLARNKIFKVAPGAFRTLPVLHQLDLCHNTLHQVPRQLPPGLHSVALTHNKIQSVPRDAFCWGNNSRSLSGLVRVQLEHNSIDMGELDVHAFRCLRGFQVVHFY